MTDLVPVAEQMRKAELLAQSTLVGDGFKKAPANVLWAMDIADSLGIKVTEAMRAITVINGKPTMSAELMRGLVMRGGHLFRIITLTPDEAVVEVARRDWPDDRQTFRFGMDDATRAGLAGSATYKRHPQAMLLARVTSLACRAVFPDVLSGISYVPEEIGGPFNPDPVPVVTAARLIPSDTSDTAVDTTTGEIIDVEPEPPEAMITAAQSRYIHTLLHNIGASTKEQGLDLINSFLPDGPVSHTRELTMAAAGRLIEELDEYAHNMQTLRADVAEGDDQE